MAETRTQDNQKVFNSAVAGFQSFANGVSPNSSTKNMELIYENMQKLFDVFTQGVLLDQGANSEYILRTIYRSLGEDFVKIFQNGEAVDKIVDVLKEKQSSISPEQVETALVSDTTKKVITKTLDPNDCDPLSIVLDFTDEIQQAVLQVKLNLTREYEQRKIAYAKSYQGQQEDFEKLKQQFQEQDNEISSKLQELGLQDDAWRKEQIESTKKLLDALDSNKEETQDLDRQIEDISKLVDQKQIDSISTQVKETAKQANKFNVKNILTRIRKPMVKLVSKTTVIEKTDVVDNQTVQIYQPETPKKIRKKPESEKINKVDAVEFPSDSTKKESKPTAFSGSSELQNQSGNRIQVKDSHLGSSSVEKSENQVQDFKVNPKKVSDLRLRPDNSQEKKDNENDDIVRRQVIQDVIDGKIKTPIPTQAIEPMLKTEQAFKEQFQKIEDSSKGKITGFQNPMGDQETLGDLDAKSGDLDAKSSKYSRSQDVEEPKAEAPKVEEPRVEEPRVEEPKVQKPTVQEPKVEQSQLEKNNESSELKKGDSNSEKETIGTKLQVLPKVNPRRENESQKQGQDNGTKLDWKLLPDGRKQCPFCHSIFDKEGVGTKITEQGVISNIARFHQGTVVLINDEKFKQNFLLDYKPIQKQVQNQMFGIDQEEMKTKKDLSETEQGINDIKRGKGSFLSKLLFGAWKMAFIVAGGILLRTSTRLGFRAWSNNFMPKSDGSKFKIFGLEIPGLGEIKAFGLGIWNTITVGLPNLWNRVKNFFGKIHKQLFGKKGMFRDAIETRNTLRKIGAAFIIGLSTKATGPIFKIFGFPPVAHKNSSESIGYTRILCSSDGIKIFFTFFFIDIKDPVSIQSYLPSCTRCFIACLAFGNN